MENNIEKSNFCKDFSKKNIFQSFLPKIEKYRFLFNFCTQICVKIKLYTHYYSIIHTNIFFHTMICEKKLNTVDKNNYTSIPMNFNFFGFSNRQEV